MASLGALRISVALLPLFTGEIRVSSIILDKPVIHLEVSPDGRSNWTFRQGRPGGGGLPRGLRLSGIAIRDGSLSYANAQTGKTIALEGLDLQLDVTRLDAPAALSGHFTRAGSRADFSGSIATLQSLSAGEATRLGLSLKSDLLTASFNGVVAADHSLTGTLAADAASARRLGAWLGVGMPAGSGLGKLSLSANLAYRTGLASLDALKLALDGMTVTGRLTVATDGPRPRLGGQLAADRLDFNPYMQSAASEGAGWSRKPIAFDMLKRVDADLALSAGAVLVRKLAIGKTSLRLVLVDGVLHADLDRMTLYGGSGHARLDLDDSGRVPQIRTSLDFSNVAMARFLGDTIGVRRVEGSGRLVLDAASRGASTDAMMRALSGKGAITVGNGQIRGVNLGLVATTVKSVLSAGATGDAAATRFSTLGGSFTIASGVLTSNDMRLEGPVFTASGQGSLDLGAQTIDFHIAPKADVVLANISVPFFVRGPWSHPRYLPDLVGLATGTARSLANGASGAAGLLGGILGRGKSSSGSSRQSGGLLGGLLGAH
jgi:AsmA protein